MIGASRDGRASLGAVVTLGALGLAIPGGVGTRGALGAAGRRGALVAVGALGVFGLAIACGHGRGRGTLPLGAASEGISIAIYDRDDTGDPDAAEAADAHAAHGDNAYGVIDDRRWIDVASDSVILDHVDPRAVLQSLVIEPLAGAALTIGACLRDRIPASASAGSQPAAIPPPTVFAPVLRCAVHGPHGRYLVRLLYVVPALGYRARHDIAMTVASRATVTSRFAIVTPAWHARAEITLFDGIPGTQQPPHELARGMVMLDGGTAVIATPPRVVAGQLRRIYAGAMQKDDASPSDIRWRRESHPAVWVWLELDDPALARAPGPVGVHVALAGEPVRDIDVPARGRRRPGAALQLPLWIDDQLHGRRDRWTRPIDDARLLERFAMSIANLGDTARDVWIEEQLRPSRRRTISRTWPGEPTVIKTQLRMKLTVAPGKIERSGFEVEYER